MASRQASLEKVLQAVATMVAAYADYSEATLQAAQSLPGGTTAPVINMGPANTYGASWGPCERLLLAEMYRLAPQRKDGAGRFVLPFANSSPLATTTNHNALPAAIDEFKRADGIVLAEIRSQVETLDKRAMNAAQKAAA
jgi:hypothetical protein